MRPAPIAVGNAVKAGRGARPDRLTRALGATGRRDPLFIGLQKLNWKDREFFLTIADAGSIRKGSAQAGCTVKTTRRRLARIEDVIGEPLALRDNAGLLLTEAGTRLLGIVRRMQAMMDAEASEPDESGVRTALRIAVTEGLGSFWLMPRLVEFQKANPDLNVRLFCDMQRVDLAGGEFDIAVQLEPVTSPALTPTRLGTLHLMPFASDSYLRSFGAPQSIDDWPKHRLVWQEADQVASHLLPYHIGTQNIGDLIAITTNSSSAHFRAVAQGGGIGLLPTYARAISRKVKPLDIGLHLKREIVCAVHVGQAQLDHVQRGLRWLKAAFSSDSWPWFQDRFIHPDDFESSITSGNVISLFEGYIDPVDPDGPAHGTRG